MATPPPPRRRLVREARRAQLVEAAAAAFLAGGFDGTSMEDVAQRAGVSRLIVYRNFETKTGLYTAVLESVLHDLAARFADLSGDEVRERGAANVIMTVARARPDAFRLLWRHASTEPEFREIAVVFREYVTRYAGEILRHYLADEVLVDWGAHVAGAHLIEGICTWLDRGVPERDAELATTMTAGIRAMVAGWSGHLTAS